MKQPLLVRLFISEKELKSYRQQAALTLNSYPLCLFVNILTYVCMTLIFSSALSWKHHVIFGLALLAMCLVYMFFVKRAERDMQHSAQRCLIWILVSGSLIFTWWQSYFLALQKTNNLFNLHQFHSMMVILMFIGVLTVGRFNRVSCLFIIATLLNMAPRLLIADFSNNKILVLQILSASLAELFFLRTLNAHVSRLLDTEEKNSLLLEKLQLQNLSLEQANYSHSRYLSAASHDLRQPLHALALLTNDVQRKNTESKITGQLKKMELAIDSLSQSFNAMLNLSRLDAGGVTPNFSFFSLQDLFERLHIEYADLAFEKHLSLTIHPSKLYVLSDKDLLYSILSNFVSNALRYTKKGGVLIGTRPNNNGTFKVIVYDTGSGVPPEKAKQIFQEYKRLDEAESRVRGGVGLGLAIVERTARLLNTKLWVRSTLGKGSAFGITIHTNVGFQEMVQPTPEYDLLSNKRIAIVDDDEWALESLQDLLLDWKMDVSLILSSDMLTELMNEEGAFDFIISDYHLGNPNETGLDLIRTAQQFSPEKPPDCLILTGDTRSELAQEAIAAGVPLWHKPIRPAHLRSYLNNLAQQRQHT